MRIGLEVIGDVGAVDDKRGQYISEAQAQRVIDVLHKHGEELLRLVI